jgi:hypothetical protein
MVFFQARQLVQQHGFHPISPANTQLLYKAGYALSIEQIRRLINSHLPAGYRVFKIHRR